MNLPVLFEVESLRQEYVDAVEVERLAHRQKRDALAALLHAMSIPARYTTLSTTSERSLSWSSDLTAYLEREHLSPSWRRKIRQFKAEKFPHA